MSDGDNVVQLRQLDADVAAALAAVAAGPIELAGGMWANPWRGIWRVTADRGGAEPVGRFLGMTLDDCRRWAETRAPDT